MKKTAFLVFGLLFCLVSLSQAQPQTYISGSTGSNAWENNATWTKSLSWMPNNPGTSLNWTSVTVNATVTRTGNLSNNGGTNLIVNGTLIVTGNLSLNAPLMIAAGGRVVVMGNLSMSGGGSAAVNGTLEVTGSVTANAALNIAQGGRVVIGQDLTTVNGNNVVVGTSTAPPAYAELVVQHNIISQSSGDITVNRNGRVAVFGNVTGGSNGGTLFTINQGGNVYIDGNMSFNGGGDHVVNNNTSSPYGFYVNGAVTYPSGVGSSTTGHAEESRATMQSSNNDFYTWVGMQPGSTFAPLPIDLMYFKVKGSNEEGMLLIWATAMEKNFDYFQLERAGEDLSFQPLEHIAGKGGLKTTTSYSFVDRSPLPGKNYYRLKSVDLDATFKYSNLAFAVHKTAKDVLVYPNPITNKSFDVRIAEGFSGLTQLDLVNSMGSIVFHTEITEISTSIQLENNIEPGIYFARLSSNAGQKMIRVIIK